MLHVKLYFCVHLLVQESKKINATKRVTNGVLEVQECVEKSSSDFTVEGTLFGILQNIRISAQKDTLESVLAKTYANKVHYRLH